MKMDTIALVETPEGIDLTAELVGLVPRALAYSIDFAIRVGVMVAASIVLGLLGKSGDGLMLILWFALEWWYPVLYEYFRDGQTIGKKSLGIKVVNDDFTHITFAAALSRNLLRVADFAPLCYGFGALSMLTTKRFQRLGDMAAGTLVVYADAGTLASVNLDDIESITPVLSLSDEQQSACINFTLNRGNMSDDRLQELATIIRPVLPGDTIDHVRYVKGVGKWLLGARSDKLSSGFSFKKEVDDEAA